MVFGLSPPIPPEIAPEIRLPHLTARSHNRPFGPEPDAPARPRRVAEGDIAKPVIVVPEGLTFCHRICPCGSITNPGPSCGQEKG